MKSNMSSTLSLLIFSAVLGRLVTTTSVPQGSPDSADDCIDTWKVLSGVKSLGGTLISELTDPQDCLDACSAAAACQGVDIEGSAAPIKCWFHFNQKDFAASVSCPEGSQHQMQRCPWSNLYTCNGVFVSSAIGQHSLGGDAQPASIKTVDQCKATCVDQGPGCAGINFDTNTNICYVHSRSTLRKKVEMKHGVVEYTMTNACGSTCTPRWARYIDTAGVGATPVPIPTGNSNATGCLEWCLRNRACVGVEFTPSNALSCAYYSTNEVKKLEARAAKPGTTQYHIADACSQFCQAHFVPVPSTQFHIFNPFTLPATTLRECADWCTTSANCTIYQTPKSGPMVCKLGTDSAGPTQSQSVNSYIWQTYDCKP